MMRKLLIVCNFIVFGVSSVDAQNNSINFDGTNDRVRIMSSGSFTSTNTLTLEAWINADLWKPNAWQGTIIGKDAPNTTGFVLRCGNNGVLDFTVGTGSNWQGASTAAIMQANVWNHVAAVVNNGAISLYVNGILSASGTTSGIGLETNDILVGESSGFPGRAFDGRIDEVRIWNTVRTQAEIQTAATIDLPASTPNLLAYLKMDQVTAGITPNEINASNNGVLENFTGSPLSQGYGVFTDDISVSFIQAPDLISTFNKPSKVKATFKNFGTNTISSFVASYSIDGGVNFIDETVNQTILPSESFDYTFNQIMPRATGSFSLSLKAALAGDQNSSNDIITSQYAAPANANEIIIFSSEQHNFGSAGQTNFAGITLPDDNLMFSKILMEISVSCPSTGCDPWDQPAQIFVQKNGEKFEIARYITPFGKGCGPWTVDVTDFKNLLKGYTKFESFIQVWGQSGWLLNVKLIYENDPLTNPYQNLTSLWSENYFVYGDPNISYDLPPVTNAINSNTNTAKMRMTISGHGQGNTNNAAEFSNFTHQVLANGSVVNVHNLWKNDCDANTCSNQLGTWLFPRAGWCPGQEVQPYEVNLTSNVSGGNLTVDYQLQNYTNLINTGYNGGSHTEPHYRIHAYIVEESDQYINAEPLTDLAATAILSPQIGSISTTSPVTVRLENYGSETIVNPEIILQVNGAIVATETVLGTILAGNNLDYTFNYIVGFNANTNYEIVVVVNALNDEATTNDIVTSSINSGTASLQELLTNSDLNLYPNPSTGKTTIEGKSLTGHVTLSVMMLDGKVVYEKSTQAEGIIKLEENFVSGTYLMKIETEQGNFVKQFIIL